MTEPMLTTTAPVREDHKSLSLAPSSPKTYAPPIAARWYSYRNSWGQAKDSQEAPEIPHRGSLLRFCEADSDALEAAFSSRRDELERAWWEEEAANPSAAKPGSRKVAATAELQISTAEATDRGTPDGDASWLAFMLQDTGEEVGVLVRSGTYEVDLTRRILQPCYWPAAKHRVLRGTWFAEKGGEWVPLRESLADQIEQAYASRAWEPNKGLVQAIPSPDKTALPGYAARLELTTSVDSGFYALFYDENEAYLCRDSSFAWLRRLGAGAAAAPTRLRLRRGYEPPATPAALQKEADQAAEFVDDAAARAEPTHLVLVVHGIGQTLQGANIAEDVIAMRTSMREVERTIARQQQEQLERLQQQTAGAAAAAAAEPAGSSPKKSPRPVSLPPQPTSRVEVLPVQWRKTLSLEVDALAAALRPPGISSLRSVLHGTAVEVLQYMTPMHRTAILASLVTSLNSIYARFMLRNPEFRGPVSIAAHSLGSILCWDILCNQPDVASPTAAPSFPVAAAQPPPGVSFGWSAAPVAIERLSFEVDQLVLIGSPLGCFLALRGVDCTKGRGLGMPGSAPLMQAHPDLAVAPDGLPAVRRLYHVYHPFDPVAYRLEPLAYSFAALARHRGALVEYFHGGGAKRLHIAAQELGDNVSSAASRLGSTLKGALLFRRGSTSKVTETVEEAKGAGGMQGEEAAAEGGSPMGAAGEGEAGEPMDIEFGGEDDAAAANASAPAAVEASPQKLSSSLAAAASQPQLGQKGGGVCGATSATIARVAGGGLPAAGGWPSSAAGRIDFALQESSIGNQYLSALSAHFSYWSSLDVALFLHRAVKGRDVINGKPLTAAASAVASHAGIAAKDAPAQPVTLTFAA